MLSGMIGLAAALALAAPTAVRAENFPPLDPVFVPNPAQPPEPPRSHCLYRLLHPWCYAHHLSDYNCGSLVSDGRFILSGCRIFWNEPCNYDKPPVLLPDGTPYPLPPRGSGNGYGNGNGGGCPSCRW
jgi:hypothetical protein